MGFLETMLQNLFRERILELREQFRFSTRRKDEVASRLLEAEYLASAVFGREFVDSLYE